MNSNKEAALGIDIGNVLITGGNEMFTSESDFLSTGQMPGAFDAVKRLVTERFGLEKVFLVSKCGSKMQIKTAAWLRYHSFYQHTGVREDHLHFCLKRDGKAQICQKFGITIFIDDRLEVLSHILRLPPPTRQCLLFQGKVAEVAQHHSFLNLITQVNSWQEVLWELLP